MWSCAVKRKNNQETQTNKLSFDSLAWKINDLLCIVKLCRYTEYSCAGVQRVTCSVQL